MSTINTTNSITTPIINILFDNVIKPIWNYLPSSALGKISLVGLPILSGFGYYVKKSWNQNKPITNPDALPPLHFACNSGDLKKVKAILNTPEGQNQLNQFENGLTPLMFASKAGKTDVVKFLILQKSTNLNLTTSNGFSALHLACRDGRTEIAKLLLDNNFNPNLTTVEGWTPLMHAAHNLRPAIVQLLLNYNVNINAQDKNGETALIKVCKKSKEAHEIVELLVKRRELNPNLRDTYGWTALDYACRHGRQKIVEILVRIESINVNTALYGKTPLHLAALNNFTPIVKILLSHKNIDVNPREKRGGWTPLHCAAKNANKEMISLLVNNGALIDVRDDLGRTPLHLETMIENNFYDFDYLLKNGANPHLKDNEGKTPFDMARENMHFDATTLLYPYTFDDGFQEVGVLERTAKNVYKTDKTNKPIQSSYWRDLYTNDLYQIESPFLTAKKTIVHFVLTPVHALYVTAKNLAFIAIDLGKIAKHTLVEFGKNFKKIGLFSSLVSLGRSIVIDIPKTFAYSIWKVVRIPLYTGGMLMASAYAAVNRRGGLTMMNQIGSMWEETGLLHLTGLKKVGNLTQDKINGVAKYALCQ